MASSVQIVPKWHFPHVETYVYDNTEVTDTQNVTVDDSVKTIHVFRSSKGIDNKVIKKTNTDDFESTWGKTDYKKYGQPLMMPYASLSSGRASTFNMRIMPDDATYANMVLFAYFRVASITVAEPSLDENGDEQYNEEGALITEDVTKSVFQIMYRFKFYSPEVDPSTNRLVADGDKGVTTKADLIAKIKSDTEIKKVEDDGNGPWTCLPIIYGYMTGHGIYGNKYKWRVTRNQDYEKDYGKRMYTFEVLNTEGTLQSVVPYVGTIAPCVYDNRSVIIQDVIDDYELGDYPAQLSVFDENVDTMYKAYSTFLSELAGDTGVEISLPDEDQVDFLFGTELNSSVKYSNMQIIGPDSTEYPIVDDPNAVNIADVLGIPFGGGYDGAFSTFIDVESGETINGALELITKDIYVKAIRNGITHLKMGEATMEDYVYALAFVGKLDKSILSKRRVPSDYLLDANYSEPTKLSFAQFGLLRDDAVIYIDTGIDYDTFSTSVLRKLKNSYSKIYANRLFSINAHAENREDPFTKRRVAVTMTHRYAEELPILWRTEGMEIPYAKAHARFSVPKRDSLWPVVDLNEESLMEELANMRINYIEAIDERTFQRGVQNTGQSIDSDLLEENNMHVLCWLKRNIERDVYDSLYNFSSANDRATFKQIEEAKYENIVGNLVESFSIEFDMNEYESKKKVIHCYVEVVFRPIAKHGIIEIDVNKRSEL